MKILTMPARTEQHGAVVPQLWATVGNLASAVETMRSEQTPVAPAPEKPKLRVLLTPEVAFYRKYTEGMLRRYAALRMEGGRVPSLLGRALFRGKVSSYRVHGFDDVVIFVHDVERCILLLSEDQKRLIHRIAVQEYTFEEAAALLEMSLRSTKRWYTEAIDELTAIFLERKLLERIVPAGCQGGKGSTMVITYSNEKGSTSN